MNNTADSINMLHPVTAYGAWHPYIPTGYVGFIDVDGMAWIVPRAVYVDRDFLEGIAVDACFPMTVKCLKDGYTIALGYPTVVQATHDSEEV